MRSSHAFHMNFLAFWSTLKLLCWLNTKYYCLVGFFHSPNLRNSRVLNDRQNNVLKDTLEILTPNYSLLIRGKIMLVYEKTQQ